MAKQTYCLAIRHKLSGLPVNVLWLSNTAAELYLRLDELTWHDRYTIARFKDTPESIWSYLVLSFDPEVVTDPEVSINAYFEAICKHFTYEKAKTEHQLWRSVTL